MKAIDFWRRNIRHMMFCSISIDWLWFWANLSCSWPTFLGNLWTHSYEPLQLTSSGFSMFLPFKGPDPSPSHCPKYLKISFPEETTWSTCPNCLVFQLRTQPGRRSVGEIREGYSWHRGGEQRIAGGSRKKLDRAGIQNLKCHFWWIENWWKLMKL